LGGVDLASLDQPGKRGMKVSQELYDAGLLVKLTGDCVLLSPPLISEEKHLDEIFTKLAAVLRQQ
jgi:beta-alanine--pyruvate transaminase